MSEGNQKEYQKEIKRGHELQAESMASAKALRSKRAWRVWGTEKLELEHRPER